MLRAFEARADRSAEGQRPRDDVVRRVRVAAGYCRGRDVGVQEGQQGAPDVGDDEVEDAHVGRLAARADGEVEVVGGGEEGVEVGEVGGFALGFEDLEEGVLRVVEGVDDVDVRFGAEREVVVGDAEEVEEVGYVLEGFGEGREL
jgi:hypothetical protein